MQLGTPPGAFQRLRTVHETGTGTGTATTENGTAIGTETGTASGTGTAPRTTAQSGTAQRLAPLR